MLGIAGKRIIGVEMHLQSQNLSSSPVLEANENVNGGTDPSEGDPLVHHEQLDSPVIALPAWEIPEKGTAFELKSKDNLIVIGSVLGAFFVFLIIVCVFFSFRRVQRRKESESLSSDDNGIKASVSTPSLHTWRSKEKQVLRSRSVGTSLSSSPTEAVTSAHYPQPDISEQWSAAGNTSSSSSPSAYEQCLPFQRSFHFENLPFLELSVKKRNDQLTVVILKFSELADNVRSACGSSSSGLFVKVFLLPDEICQQTKIHQSAGSGEQSFNDVLCFEDTKSNTCLLFSTYVIDDRHMRLSLGHATIPLENEDYERSYRVHLEELSNMLHYGLGELELTLTFLPDRSRLAVTLNSCKDLTLTDVRPSSKLLIKVEFLQGRKVVKEKYFRLMKMERNPVINETCSFKMATKRADISHLKISLVEANDNAADRSIGQIAIGPYLYARGEGHLHWQTILKSARNPTTMLHLFEPATDI